MKNLFFLEAKCGATKRTFYPRYDLGAGGSWVLTYGVKELPGGQKVSDTENTRLDFSDMRNGPQYKCPWCGNKSYAMCGHCGKITCYNDRDYIVICAHCGGKGKISGTISQDDMKGIVRATGSGQ